MALKVLREYYEKDAAHDSGADESTGIIGLLESGLEGVKMALKVLREYYEKDAAHDSGADESTGIIGLLEVVESDFTKNVAEMTANEATAQAEYERDTKENQIEKATKSKDVEYKTRESVQLDAKTREAKSDLEGVQTELSA